MRNITFSFFCIVLLVLCSSVFALRGATNRKVETGHGSEGRDAVETVDNRDLKQKWRTGNSSTNKRWKRRKQDRLGNNNNNNNSNSNNNSNNNSNQRIQAKPCDKFCNEHHTPWCVKRNSDFSVKGKCSWKRCSGCAQCVKSDPCASKRATTAYDALPENHKVACPENERDRINALNFFDDDTATEFSKLEYGGLDCSCCYYGWWQNRSTCCVPFGSSPP